MVEKKEKSQLEEKLSKKDASGLVSPIDSNANSSNSSDEQSSEEDEIKKAIKLAQQIEEIISESHSEDVEESKGIAAYSRFSDGSDPNPIYFSGKSIDYDELFSHIATLETRNPYEHGNAATGESMLAHQSIEHRAISESEILNVVKDEKYHTPGFLMSGSSGLVPRGGMSSEQWEAYKLKVVLEPHLVQIRWKMA